MMRVPLFGAYALAGLLYSTTAVAWTEESPEVGGIAPPAETSGPARVYDLEPEWEILGAVQTFSDNDLDRTYGLLGGGGLGWSVRSGQDTRFVVRLQYLRSKGDPYYDQPSFDAGTPATLQVVPISLGVRHDLAPNSRLRVNAGASLGFDWTREEMPDPNDPARTQAHDGIGWGLQLSLGPEYRSRDERRGFGIEFVFAHHQVELTGAEYGGHELNRRGLSGSAYLVFALGDRDASKEAVR
ncbi:MAG: hypothetical protein GY838_03635 [bacterium]|nr:hypothetical protein [bacterium]